MAITMATAHVLKSYGVFKNGLKILDFGSSNLYDASADEIVEFVQRYKTVPQHDLEDLASRLSEGSGLGEDKQALNQSFIGEMLEAAGMTYESIDIASGYKTHIMDLNFQRLPKKMVGKYDCVINAGTSEHILNQLNTFAAVHQATKEGGLMVHMLPSVGFVDHGYFCYTSKFFYELAARNRYDVVDIWFDQAHDYENQFQSSRQHQHHFPSVAKRLELIGKDERDTQIDHIQVPTVLIYVILRRLDNAQFACPLELSTSVGELGMANMAFYGRQIAKGLLHKMGLLNIARRVLTKTGVL